MTLQSEIMISHVYEAVTLIVTHNVQMSLPKSQMCSTALRAHLLVGILLQEGEQQQEALVRGHAAVALLQALPRAGCLAVVDAHVQRLPLERQPRKVLDLQHDHGKRVD